MTNMDYSESEEGPVETHVETPEFETPKPIIYLLTAHGEFADFSGELFQALTEKYAGKQGAYGFIGNLSRRKSGGVVELQIANTAGDYFCVKTLKNIDDLVEIPKEVEHYITTQYTGVIRAKVFPDRDSLEKELDRDQREAIDTEGKLGKGSGNKI